MLHQINSFKFAIKGIIYSIKNEGHMRFHLVIGTYILIFSNFYDFSVTRKAVLLLLIGCVLMAEVFNTALETLCDLESDSYNNLARIAKDVAAGAVLFISIISAVIGFLFFWNLKVFEKIYCFFAENTFLFVLLVFSLIISFVFVCFGPVGIRKIFIKLKSKNR